MQQNKHRLDIASLLSDLSKIDFHVTSSQEG